MPRGRPPYKKHSLAPIPEPTEFEIESDNEVFTPNDFSDLNINYKRDINSSEKQITETSNIDAYISKSEEKCNDFSEKDAEIEVLNEKLSELEKENKEFREDNKTLLSKLEVLLKEKGNFEKSSTSKEIEDLKRDNNILREQINTKSDKITELENERLRLTNLVKTLQSNLDNRLHTYSKSGYSGKGGFVSAQNGYQDWQ